MHDKRPTGSVTGTLIDPTAGFADRAAIITGASRGIGFAIASELVRRGCAVCITARKPEELAVASQRLSQLGQADVLTSAGGADDIEHQARTVQETLERFGRIDFLVNNAAVNPHYGPAVEADFGTLQKIFAVNVSGALGWVRCVWRAWLDCHEGSVLNMASIGGLRADPSLGPYNASKAALIHLTRQLAHELAPRVRVNAIAPALIRTGFARVLYENREEEAASHYPLDRIGETADVVGPAMFLLGPESSWITGQTLVVDGGSSIRP